MKIYDVVKLLQHAAWHCRYGSNADNTERKPEPSDIEAAEILERKACEL